MRELLGLRDFQMPGKSVAYGVGGMAATSHPQATLTAIDVLRAGGNAVDAAVAAVAVLSVVEPAMTSIGGDCFVLYAPASGGVVALNGSGRAPMAASLERFTELGIVAIGPHSAHAVTIPGAVAAWELLLVRMAPAASMSCFARRSGSPKKAAPSLRASASTGTATPPSSRPALGRSSTTSPAARPRSLGRIMAFPALARTLRAIAEGGAKAFYTGPLAEAMVRTLQGMGGLHELSDFSAASAEFVEPIYTTYRDVHVYECPPNGQGLVALLILNTLEGYELSSMQPLGAERLHLIAEAAKLAFRDRDAFLADPAFADVPVQRLLDKAYAGQLREQINLDQALKDLPPPLLEAHPDTTYLSVVDRDLNAVSFINSLFNSFGSGIACEKTGVLFHNRGRAFRLMQGHPNRIGPGKRPMHTIIPGMAFRGGEAWLSFGVMGGDYQPVGQASLISNLVDHGFGLQVALERRGSCPTPRPSGRARYPPAARPGLQLLGHRIVEPEAPLGGAQAVMIDRRRGVLLGASDPRKDGIALGF